MEPPEFECRKRLEFSEDSSGYSTLDPGSSSVTVDTTTATDGSGDFSEGVGCGPSESGSTEAASTLESEDGSPQTGLKNVSSSECATASGAGGTSVLSIVAPAVPASTSMLSTSGTVFYVLFKALTVITFVLKNKF